MGIESVSDILTLLSNFIIGFLGDWVVSYAAVILIVAALFFLLFIILVIVAAVRGSKLKQMRARFQACADVVSQNGERPSEDELREQIRAELKPQIREEIEPLIKSELEAEMRDDFNNGAAVEYTAQIESQQQQINEMALKIDELNNDINNKQARLDDLTHALEQQAGAAQQDNSEFYNTINSLNRTVKEQENQINLLRAENSQIKAQVLQEQLAAAQQQVAAQQAAAAAAAAPRSKPAAETTATDDTPRRKPAAAKPAAAKPASKPAAKQPEPEPAPEPVPVAQLDEDDEYDEYFDDYGDENSAIKVTLKFDRLKNNWVILRSDTDRAYRRMATKQDAIIVAKDLARRLHAQLVVHKKDGKFQKI